MIMTDLEYTFDEIEGKRSKEDLIGFLADEVRDETIEKAAFLSQFEDPDLAFDSRSGTLRRFTEDGFGMITAFASKDEMDKASVEVALSASGYEPLLADSLSSVKNMAARTLNTYRIHESLELYEDALAQFRESYRKVLESEDELMQKQTEYRRCSAALRSLKEEDSWLNRENKRQVTRIKDAERQAMAHQEAKRQAQEQMDVFDEQLTDANEKLPINLAELEAAEKRAEELNQEIAVLEKKTTFIGGLFRKDRNQLKEELEQKRKELEEIRQKQQKSQEGTQKLQLEIERLEENVRTHKTEAAKIDSAFNAARNNLIKARQEYNDGERKFAKNQDRIKEAKRKMDVLEDGLRVLEGKDRAVRADCLLTARRVLMAFLVSSKVFRDNLKKISRLNEEETVPEGALETVLFWAPVIFVEWNKAEPFLMQRTSDTIGMIIGVDTDPNNQRALETVIFE